MQAEQIYWLLAVIELALAAGFGVPTYWQFAKLYDRLHPLVRAFLVLLIPDFLLVLNFLPLHIANLAIGPVFDVPEGICQLSAFATLASILANNAGVVFIARSTYLIVRGGPQQEVVTMRKMLIWMGSGWVLGLLMATAYSADHNIGVHRGLYCCLKHLDRLEAVLPTGIVFSAAVSMMVYYYNKTYRLVRKVQQSSVGSTRSSGTNLSDRILHRAVLLISVYYSCWTWVSIDSFLAFFGVAPPLWSEIVAAILIKCGPLLNILIIRNMLRNRERYMAAQQNRATTYVQSVVMSAAPPSDLQSQQVQP